MVRVSTINLTSVPEDIRKEPFFMACVEKNLPESTGHYSSQLNVDHVALYRCEEKTLSFVKGWQKVSHHPQFAELSRYTNEILGAEFKRSQDQLLFFQGAIELLDDGLSLAESTARASSLVLASWEFHKPREVVHEDNVPPQVKEPLSDETKALQETLISSLRDRSISISCFERSLKRLSRREMEGFQKSCAYVLEKHLKKQGMDPEQAKQQVLDVLGRDFGFDGKYGSHTRDLARMVTTLLIEEGRMELSEVKDAKALSQSIHDINIVDAAELAISKME